MYEISSAAIAEMTIATLSILIFKHELKSTKGADGKFKDTFKINPECRQSMQRVRRGISVILDVLRTNGELEKDLQSISSEPDVSDGNVGAWMERYSKAAKEVEKQVHDKLYELEDEQDMSSTIAPLKRKRYNNKSGASGKVLHLTTLITRLEKTTYIENFKQM